MDELLLDSLAMWRESAGAGAAVGRVYSDGERRGREEQLDGFLGVLEGEVQRLPRTRAERVGARERITSAFVRFAEGALGFDGAQISLLLEGGFSAIGTELGRAARRFDPGVSASDILQASRNAWTACGLQVLLGVPMGLTPSIFAYSMLYPYTDNYLDEPGGSREEKAGFNGRFGRRLSGEDVEAANGREAAIWRLISLIEEEYSRADSPEVFASLLRIQRAQEESLRLLRAGGDADVEALVFEKGGASVLADGYLAAGRLTAEQARFVFSWGVLLQLADDLQDVRQDCRDGVRTLFSEAAGRGTLDAVTSRTLQFAGLVMRRMREMAGPECGALKDLMERSAASMVVRSVGEAAELYSPGYAAEMERRSPFGFSFLRARRGARVTELFEAFLAGDEDEAAFPLLPGALMHRG
ncbi:MAG: hypothetical protein ACM336_09485 [Acidobacteriota bacterium]